MNSWKSVESMACLPPFRMFTSGTGSVRAPGTAEVAIQRQSDRLGRGMRHRQAHAEQRVRPELRLVRGPVEVDEQPIEADLVDGVDADQLRPKRLVDVTDRGEDPLAAVASFVAVAQLDGLVRTGRGAGRDHGGSHRPVLEEDVDLDGRIPARVEDLASDHILDQGGHASSWEKLDLGIGGQERLDAGQRLALEELEGRAAAGADVGHAVGQPELLDGRHRVTAADDGHGLPDVRPAITRAIALVPSAICGISNTPIGPFQKIVLAFARWAV